MTVEAQVEETPRHRLAKGERKHRRREIEAQGRPEVRRRLEAMLHNVLRKLSDLKNGHYEETPQHSWGWDSSSQRTRRFVPNPNYSQQLAEGQLEALLLRAKLAGLRHGAVTRQVHTLIDQLHWQGNNWLVEVVGKNSQGQEVLRHAILTKTLQARLTISSAPPNK